jgi:glycerophosphoryl diester phosphodiesterase
MIAHRGLHNNLIPENSLAAFRKCIERNIPFEFDVHILKDGTVIVFHDDNLKRMTGMDKYLISCDYDDINKLYLKNSKEKIPTLDEVLKLVNGKVLIDIELKYDQKRYLLEDAVIKILKKYKGPLILKSFDFKTVIYLKKKTDYSIGLLLYDIDKEKKDTLWIERFFLKSVNFLKLSKPDFVACQLSMLPDKRITKYREEGHPVYIWTISTEEELERAKEFGNYFLVEKIV